MKALGDELNGVVVRSRTPSAFLSLMVATAGVAVSGPLPSGSGKAGLPSRLCDWT